MLRKLAIALSVIGCALATVLPAVAQAPAPVPALPDAERRVAYAISAATGPYAISFAVYGTGTDYANWIEVWLNGARLTPVTDFTVTLTSGTMATAARPLTNAQVTLAVASTGTLQIVGAERPRRLAQFANNQPVAARDLNVAITDLVVQNRETWDKLNDVTGRVIQAPPGETLNVLPPAATRANLLPCFDAGGQLITCATIASGIVAGQGISVAGSTLSTSAGVDTNLLATGAVITTGVSADNSYCGKTAALDGAAFFTFTVGAASGFTANCSITIVNFDASRGKTMAGFTLPVGANSPLPNILYPTQTVTIKNVNNTWALVAAPIRWKPAGSITIFVNPSTGNNSNDGLNIAAPLASTQQCLNVVLAAFDLAAGYNGINCSLAAGTTDSTLVHYSPAGGGIPGILGNQTLVIDGNGTGKLTGGIQAYNGAILKLLNLHVSGAANCVEASYGGHILLSGTITADGCIATSFFAQQKGQIECLASTTIVLTANTQFVFAAEKEALISCDSTITVSLSADITVSGAVACTNLSYCGLPNTWTLNGHTVTGLQYVCAVYGVVTNTAVLPGTGSAPDSTCRGPVLFQVGALAYYTTNTNMDGQLAAVAAGSLVASNGVGAAPVYCSTCTVAILNATTGFRIGGAATTGNVLRGNGTNFVSAALGFGDLASGGTAPAFTLGGTVSGGGNQINNVVIGTSNPLAGTFTTLAAAATTLSGQLTVTFASPNITLTDSGTSFSYFQTQNAGATNTARFGAESAAGGGIFTGSTALAAVVGSTVNQPFEIFTNNAKRLSISGAGAITVNGNAAINATKTVRASGGAADCTLVFTQGILTGGSC